VTLRPQLVVAAALFSGCASVHPTKARRDVGGLVERRTGIDDVIPQQQDEQSRTQVRERVAQLVAKPLTVERAVQIALLNNREFRVVLEELGVAQADLVQAGLLQNPVIAGDLVFSTKGNGLGGGVSLTQSLISVFLIPAKVRLAKSRLAHAVVTVGEASLTLARDVRVAYMGALAAERALELQRSVVQAAEVADELSQRQLDAGNVPILDRQLFASTLDQARVDWADAQLEATIAREELNHLLGLWGDDVAWSFAGSIPGLPVQDPDLGSLERYAVRDRLDLSAARLEIDSIEHAIGLRRRGLVTQFEAGATARNEVGTDAGHEWVIGPEISLELPIFDPGHADIARMRAHLRQAEHRLQDAAIETRSEVRVHREQLVAARRKVEYYRKTILPRAEEITALTLRQYNAMQIGTYQLLETRADELEARRGLVQALRDYWVAHSELELVVGGRLPAAAAPPSDNPRTTRTTP
jgi:cobalt-zinc-cadmium efflux system outer membrane protein